MLQSIATDLMFASSDRCASLVTATTHVAAARLALTFVDIGDGRSRIDGLSVYQTAEDRDALLDVDRGRDEDYERLEELLERQPAAV